jgi:hypothetical protein
VPSKVDDSPLEVPEALRHLVKANLYPEAARIICWIDPLFHSNTNAEAALQIRKEFPKVMSLNFPSVLDFNDWFDKEGVHVTDRLRVISGGYRENDGKERAADNVVFALENDPRKVSIPLCVFVSIIRPNVAHLTKKVLVTTDALVLKKFCTENR